MSKLMILLVSLSFFVLTGCMEEKEAKISRDDGYFIHKVMQIYTGYYCENDQNCYHVTDKIVNLTSCFNNPLVYMQEYNNDWNTTVYMEFDSVKDVFENPHCYIFSGMKNGFLDGAVITEKSDDSLVITWDTTTLYGTKLATY